MGIGEAAVGEVLSPLVKPPITLDQLKRYAKASGDYNPIHVDEEAAQRVGLDSVIAHGMLSMAFLGQFITQQIVDLPGAQLLHFQVRFSSMVRLGDVLTCHGIIRERKSEQERELITVECWAQNQKGEKATSGKAIVSIVRT